jgi:hypothetical protein
MEKNHHEDLKRVTATTLDDVDEIIQDADSAYDSFQETIDSMPDPS